MSAMKFREPNQVLWRGVRPGHNGTQVAKSNAATNTTIELHQVTSGKTLYLTSFTFQISINGTGFGQLVVFTNAQVSLYTMLTIRSQADVSNQTVQLCFPFPLEIPSLSRIKISGIGAGVRVDCFIHGWEE